MISIKNTHNPILVDSAFGGLGIYKKNLMVQSRYIGLSSNNEEICEHVSFNEKLTHLGYKLYIIPSLINGGWNEHNRGLKPLRRALLKSINLFQSLISSMIPTNSQKKIK